MRQHQQSITTIEPVLHLGCGTDIHEDAYNVDKVGLEGVDQTIDLNEYPWDLPRDEFHEIRAFHVFEHLDDIEQALRECADCLSTGGKLIVKLPVGQNAIADPDHEREWIWDTPEYYCGARHWDVDVGLTVVDRDVTLRTHLNGSFGAVAKGLITLYERQHGQGRWMFDVPFTSGEFTVVFRK